MILKNNKDLAVCYHFIVSGISANSTVYDWLKKYMVAHTHVHVHVHVLLLMIVNQDILRLLYMNKSLLKIVIIGIQQTERTSSRLSLRKNGKRKYFWTKCREKNHSNTQFSDHNSDAGLICSNNSIHITSITRHWSFVIAC